MGGAPWLPPHDLPRKPKPTARHRGQNRVAPGPSGLELGPATSHSRPSVGQRKSQAWRESRGGRGTQPFCKLPAEGHGHRESRPSGDFQRSPVRAFFPWIYREETRFHLAFSKQIHTSGDIQGFSQREGWIVTASFLWLAKHQLNVFRSCILFSAHPCSFQANLRVGFPNRFLLRFPRINSLALNLFLYTFLKLELLNREIFSRANTLSLSFSGF